MLSVIFFVFWIITRLNCQLLDKLPTSKDRHVSRQLTANINDEHHRLFVQNSLLYCPGTHMCIPQYSRNVSFQMDMNECCGRCECKEECYKEGTCCPTLFLEKNETNLPQNSSLFDTKSERISDDLNCLYPQVLPHFISSEIPNSWMSYLMVWKCPDSYTDSRVSAMCKEAGKSLNPDIDISTVIPVTSLKTNFTYRNKYCGQCHGESVTNLVMWQGEVFCPLLFRFAAQSLQEMVRQIKVEKMCNLMFNPVAMVKDIPESCYWGTFTECNVTGKWDVFDPLIEAGCHGFTMTYLHHYRNVFCFMCNEKEEPLMKCSDEDYKMMFFASQYHAFLGFINFNNVPPSLFANTNTSQSNDLLISKNCPPGARYDFYKEKCRSLTCSTNLAFNGSHCRSIFHRVNPQLYELYIQFTPENPNIFINCEICVLSAINSMLDHLSQFIVETVHAKNELCDIQILYEPVNSLLLPHDPLVNISQIAIRGIVYAKSNHDYNTILSDLLKIESKMVLLNVNNSYMDISTGFDVRLIYSDSGYADEDVLLHGVKKEITTKKFYHHPKLSEFPITLKKCFIPLRTTKVTNFKTCPRINISSSELTIVENDGTCIPEIGLCLKSGQHSPLLNGFMEICSELYFESIQKIGVNKKNIDNESHVAGSDVPVPDVLPDTLTNAHYISLYFTTLSLVILIVTTFGFIRTNKYRTLTGKINTILLIMFGLAQIFQEFSSLTNRVKNLCEIAGVVTHFTWIATAFWINAACFNISKMFLMKSKLFQGMSEIKHLLLFLAYIMIMASLFVVNCIVISFLLSNGSHIGYGGLWCFIISNEMFLYTYALPIFITTLVNVIIFIIVVVKYGIHVDAQLKLAFHYRMLKRYILLSFVFALTTTLKTVYKWNSMMAILYIAIALSAAQSILMCLLLFCIKNKHKGLSSQNYYLDGFQNGSSSIPAESQGKNTLQSSQLEKGNQDIPADETQNSTKTSPNSVKALCHNSNCDIPQNSNNNTPDDSNGSTP